jgi:hypothetical protein
MGSQSWVRCFCLFAWCSLGAGCSDDTCTAEAFCSYPAPTFRLVSSAGPVTISDATLKVSGPNAGDDLTPHCDSSAAGASCSWQTPHAGSYTLQIEAPGFRTVTVDATVTLHHGSACPSCDSATVAPEKITLDPE